MRKIWSCVGSFIGFILLINGCGSSGRIGVSVQKPAAIHLTGVKEIAVVDFKGPQGSGSQIATLLQSRLMESQYFKIVEREKLNRIMDEHNLTMSGIVDESTAAEIGKLVGVDALIFGEVTTYRVERDEQGVEKVRKKVGTGRYETVDQKNIFTGKTKKVKKEIMRTVLVDEHYRIRRGTAAINFRVVGVETGELLAVHSDSKSFTSGKVKEGSHKTLKPQGEILNELSQIICQHFVRLIAPYHTLEYRKLESGKGSIKTGRNYALAGLWEEALETWKISVIEMPSEPAAYYNLGVAYEVQGMLDDAEKAYKTAVLLKQKRLYMDALARIRQAKKDQTKLQEQLQERQENQE